MSVYKGENPDFFRQSVNSVIEQTVKPSEIVIVKDGVLSYELENICNLLKEKYPGYVKFVSLEENMGLGLALQRGVLECNNALIARMDTDDIAKIDRFEKQLKVFSDDNEIVICGGDIEEFSCNPHEIHAIRRVPKTTEEIYKYARRRNPFNHMTVMFKKDAVLKVGNYQPINMLEDYDLWVRLILKKYKMINLSDILVAARTNKSMFSRRGGWKYFIQECHLYKKFYSLKFISLVEMLSTLIIRFIVRLLPLSIRKFAYMKILRGNV